MAKRRTRILCTLLACCLALIAAFAGCAKAPTPIGPWHNEELGQLLRFHDDGTVVVRTPHGDVEAVWIYDAGKNQGIVSLSGEAIGFTLFGETLTLTWGDTQTAFAPGDMEVVPAIAEATPIPTPTATPTVTPPSDTTPSPAKTSGASASASGSPSLSFPAISPFPSFSFGPIIPTVSPSASASLQISPGPHLSPHIPGDIIGNIVSSLTGTWVSPEKASNWFKFESGGSFSHLFNGYGYSGTYTYDKSTHCGTMTTTYNEHWYFEVSGDILTMQEGETFQRE